MSIILVYMVHDPYQQDRYYMYYINDDRWIISVCLPPEGCVYQSLNSRNLLTGFPCENESSFSPLL